LQNFKTLSDSCVRRFPQFKPEKQRQGYLPPDRDSAMQNQTRAAMKRVLVVDDEAFLLNGLGKALQTDSTDVMTVETGNSALQEIAASPYQLCFLDLFLPDVNGVDVLKKIKEMSPQTKVIVMTAGVVTRSMQESIEKDAYMFITKPFDLLQVKMLARRILEETA
jgi:two-component system, NtrC family, response regulator AtoC